jgi:hypothetical protein
MSAGAGLRRESIMNARWLSMTVSLALLASLCAESIFATAPNR